MLVAALVALLGTLIGIAAIAAAAQRWASERRAYLLAWSFAAAALTAALGAQAVGFAITFAPPLFRVVEVGGALFAACWVAWGITEYLARHTQAFFAARLLVASYSIVGGVILAIDPLRHAPPGGEVPDAADLYFPLPLLLLGIAHTAVMLAVFAALVLAALRTRNRDDRPVDRFVCTLLAAVAALATVAATRPGLAPLPAPVYPLLLAVGVGLLWAAVTRASAPPARETAPFARPAATRPAGPAPPRSKARGDGARRSGASARPPQPPPIAPIPGREPYGLIAIFTLVEGADGAFDRLTERTVHAVREGEPGTLLFSCHTVANMPQQRIFYELYRDRQAYEDHQRQPHVQRFSVERRPYVLATNVIELKLNAATDIPDSLLGR